MTQEPVPATPAARGDAGTIVSVETAAVSLRANPRLAVRGARGSHDSSDFLLVRVATSRGVIVWFDFRAQKPAPLPDSLRERVRAWETLRPQE
ncbi:MAG TPA: hypothetical protein PKH44_03580 [Plasticicumulans sp.]|nr:hypothetical protein [Plasticicumulans sp.]